MVPKVNIPEFCRALKESVVGRLERVGFILRDVNARPRGVIARFTRDHDALLISWEEGELCCDAVLYLRPSRWMRISINQFLWYRGVDIIRKARGMEEKLGALQLCLADGVLDECAGLILEPDWRCCFMMNQDAHTIFETAHGVRGTESHRDR